MNIGDYKQGDEEAFYRWLMLDGDPVNDAFHKHLNDLERSIREEEFKRALEERRMTREMVLFDTLTVAGWEFKGINENGSPIMEPRKKVSVWKKIVHFFKRKA